MAKPSTPLGRMSLAGMFGSHTADRINKVAQPDFLTEVARLDMNDRRHQVYRWVEVQAGDEVVPLAAKTVCEKHGVPESVFVHHLDKDLKAEQDFLSLPWAVIALILFGCMLIQHENIGALHAAERAVAQDVIDNSNFAFTGNFGAKGYEDVNSFADFWSWMNKGFMPLTNVHEVPTSEDSGLSLSATNGTRYLWHHQKLAPVKLSQDRVTVAECPNQEVARALSITECSLDVGVDTKSKPTRSQLIRAGFKEDASKTVWLNGFKQDSQQTLRSLETQQWLDARTNRVKVSLLVFHAETDLAVLTTVHFIFARSGHIWKSITHESVKMRLYVGFWDYIFDILFYLQLLYVFKQELVEMVVHGLRHPKGARFGLTHYMGIWNAVDWLYIISGLCFLVVWIVRLAMTQSLGDQLLSIPPEAFKCRSGCGDHFGEVFEDSGSAGSYSIASRVFGGVLPLILLLRTFKAFAAQPRLAVVTETLRLAMSDLAHYLIVFGSIFFTYTVMNVSFFGREVEAFSTLDRAVPSTMLLLLGSFEFEQLEVIGRSFAFFIFLSFNSLIVLVMLSMLIAIIMDVYVVVKEHSLRNEAIWSEAWDLVRRGVQNLRKQRVSLHVIRRHFDLRSEAKLYAQGVADRCPGLPLDQAERLLEEAVERWRCENGIEAETRHVSTLVEQATGFLMEITDLDFENVGVDAPGEKIENLVRNVPLEDLLIAARKALDRQPAAGHSLQGSMAKLLGCASDVASRKARPPEESPRTTADAALSTDAPARRV